MPMTTRRKTVKLLQAFTADILWPKTEVQWLKSQQPISLSGCVCVCVCLIYCVSHTVCVCENICFFSRTPELWTCIFLREFILFFENNFMPIINYHSSLQEWRTPPKWRLCSASLSPMTGFSVYTIPSAGHPTTWLCPSTPWHCGPTLLNTGTDI